MGLLRRNRPLSVLTGLPPTGDFTRGERRDLIAAALLSPPLDARPDPEKDMSYQARQLCERAPSNSALGEEYAKARRAHSRQLIANFFANE